MANSGIKGEQMKHVGFRMPLDVYHDYLAVAEARGIDLTALLNWVTAEFRPALLLKHAQHQTAMLRATLADPQQNRVDDANAANAIASVNDLIRQMQELLAVLQRRPGGDGAREAA